MRLESNFFTAPFRRVRVEFYLTFDRFYAESVIGFILGNQSHSLGSDMPKKPDVSPTSISEVLAKMSQKNYAFDFDVTLELNTPKLQVGSLRVHGRVESVVKK